MKSKWFVILAFILMLGSQASAGWMIKEVSGNPEYGDQSHQTLYFQNNRVKIIESESSVTIFDMKKQEISILLPGTKNYWTGTTEEFWNETQNAMKQQMEKALKELPPEQREAYKSMMEDIGNISGKDVPEDHKKVSVEETSEKTTIVNHSCQKYEVEVDGELIENIWISEDVNIQEEIDLDAFGHFVKTMSGHTGDWSFETSVEYINLLKQGYPMRSIEMSEWGESTVTEVTAVKKQKIPLSEFQIPKDYREIPLMELMKYQMMREEKEGDFYDEDEGYEYRD